MLLSLQKLPFYTFKNTNLKYVKYIGWGIGAYFAYWLYQRYVLGSNAEISISNFKINGNILNPQFEIEFKIANKSGVSINLDSLAGNISDEKDNLIATFNTEGKKKIEKFDYSYVPVIVSTKLSTILDSLTSFYTNKKATFKISGDAVIDGLKIPFSINYIF